MYITGFQAGINAARVMKETTNSSICLPDGFSGQQAVLIVEKFMKDHPEMLHYDQTIVVSMALVQAFPCGK